MSARRNTHSRLAALNARLTVLLHYAVNGHNLEEARRLSKQNTALALHPTYTQAHKALKAIPREHREAYQRDVLAEAKAQRTSVERQRRALRSTDTPSETVAAKKNRKQAKREATNAQA